MPVGQSWNPRINAYVKYDFTSEGIKWDIKERSPETPFKGIIIKKAKGGRK